MAKKLILMFVCVLIMGFALVSVSAGKTTITFWNGFTASDGEILREIVEKFNKENPDVKVEMDIMPWAVFYQKLPPAIATKTAPSFVLMGNTDLEYYAMVQGVLQDLNDIWSTTNLKENDFSQAVLDLYKYDEKYYGIPMQYNLIYLYWNKDMFSNAGLNPEEPPRTWEESEAFAVKLTDSSKNQFGFGMPVKTAPEWWATLIWGNGGEILDPIERKSLLNTPQNVESMEFLQNLAVEKQVTPLGATGPEIDNLLIGGKGLAMYINGPWLINGLKQNNINFGIAACPKGTVRQQMPLQGTAFAIPVSTTPEEKMAAYKFIEYWNSPDVCKEWTMRNGFPPYLNSLITDPDIVADPIQKSIAPLAGLGKAWLKGVPEGSAILSDVLWPMIEAILVGVEKPQEALQKASTRIDEILKGSE